MSTLVNKIAFALFTAGILLIAGLTSPAAAQSALSGTVSSAEEGNMEGVVVTAKKDGSPINISVVSDDKGHYSFPANRLEPGHYTVTMRAVGYDLDGAAAADVAAGKEAKADLKLAKTKNLAKQLTNAEWMISMPGSDEQKKFLLNCVGCHTVERIVTSAHSPEAFMKIIPRMGTYAPGSPPRRPQKLLPGPRGNRGETSSSPPTYRELYSST